MLDYIIMNTCGLNGRSSGGHNYRHYIQLFSNTAQTWFCDSPRLLPGHMLVFTLFRVLKGFY